MEFRKAPKSEINTIINYFKNNNVLITKLNHCMNTKGPTQYDGMMQLQADGDLIKITKKVLLLDKFILTSDDLWIQKERKRH